VTWTRRADGAEAPELPRTWRPLLCRLVAYGMAGGVVLTTVVLAITIAPPFELADRLGLVLVGLLIAGVLHLLGRCRVTADEKGITVVNLAKVHTFEWAQVLRINMGVGESWPTLDLADGSSLGAMGIQAADGERARLAVAQLRSLLHEHGEAAEPS
jgi:hypothetical protein